MFENWKFRADVLADSDAINNNRRLRDVNFSGKKRFEPGRL